MGSDTISTRDKVVSRSKLVISAIFPSFWSKVSWLNDLIAKIPSQHLGGMFLVVELICIRGLEDHPPILQETWKGSNAIATS